MSRYLGEAAGNDQNRWTSSAAHEAAYEAMPVTVEQLVARGLVDRTTVATRAQGVLYDRTVTADVAQYAAADVRRAIEVGRGASAMTGREGRAWVRESCCSRSDWLPRWPEDRSSGASRSQLTKRPVDPLHCGNAASIIHHRNSANTTVRSVVLVR